MSIQQDQRRLRAAERRRQLAARSPEEILEKMIVTIIDRFSACGSIERADLLKADIPPAVIDASFTRCLGAAKAREPKLFQLAAVP